MRKLILLFFLLASPSWATIALIQHASNTACGTSVSTCTISGLSTTGTQHLMVVTAAFVDTTTTIASVGGGGSWTICGTTCHGIDTTAVVGVDGAYLLVVTSGVTSITVTFSGSCTGAKIWTGEYSYSDAIDFDNAGKRDQSSAVTNPVGVNMTLSGTNDVAIQFISSGATVTAISGSYTNPADFSGGQGNAGAINIASNTAPTWTTGSSRAALGHMAFKELSTHAADLGTMDKIPMVVQSAQAIGATDTVTAAYPLRAGNVAIVSWRSQSNGATWPSIAGSCGESWTQQLQQGNGANKWAFTWTATMPYNCVLTVTVTPIAGGSEKIGLLEVANVTETLDASAEASTAIASNSVTAPNVTTNAYRDLVLYIILNNSSGRVTPQNSSSPINVEVGQNALSAFLMHAYSLSGNPGSITGPTFSSSDGAATSSQGVIALKATSALSVCTQSLPNAVSGTAYTAKLCATGGTGSNTWSVTSGSLPCGLSVSGDTVTGTPTCSNGNTITFQVQDAASATATQGLTLTVGTSFNTIAHLQTRAAAGASLAFSSNVTSGSLILVTTAESNASYASVITDSLGTNYSMLPSIGTFQAAGNTGTLHYWGFAPSSGPDTVTISQTSNVAGIVISEFSNVQQFFDTGYWSNTQSTAGGNASSGSVTPPVTETLYGVNWIGTLAGTVSADSPFTQAVDLTSGRHVNASYKIGASGATSASWTVGSNTSNDWGNVIFGFRPTTSGLAPAGGIRHRVTQN